MTRISLHHTIVDDIGVERRKQEDGGGLKELKEREHSERSAMLAQPRE